MQVGTARIRIPTEYVDAMKMASYSLLHEHTMQLATVSRAHAMRPALQAINPRSM
jgi:hypothetical protein